jgi:putative transcriptional regulator
VKEKIIRARLRADGKVVRIMPDGREKVLRIKPIAHWSDEHIEAAALSDPDNPPLTSVQLAKMRRVPRVKTLRRALGLSQEEFASRFQIPLGTLRDWEQGRTEPDQAARAYLNVIAHNPENVRDALRAAEKKRPRRSNTRRVRGSV